MKQLISAQVPTSTTPQTPTTAVPAVSIVLPCYNGASHLGQAIESVQEQTFTDWELILVDDCSTDESLAVMERYASLDSRLRIVRNSVNLKLPASLNRGFAEARGRLLTWTSHDNRLAPTMLNEMVAYLDAHPDVGLVTACYDAFDLATGRTLYEVHHPDPQQHLPLFNCVCYAFLYRRTVMEAVGDYDEGQFLVEDYDYWLRTWLRFPIGKIDKVLYHTGVGDSTLTHSRKAEIAHRLVEMRLNYFDSLNRAMNEYPDMQRKLYISIADNLHGFPRIRFTFQRGTHFATYYWLFLNPKKRIGKILRTLCRHQR